jgi:hypothetical protein
MDLTVFLYKCFASVVPWFANKGDSRNTGLIWDWSAPLTSSMITRRARSSLPRSTSTTNKSSLQNFGHGPSASSLPPRSRTKSAAVAALTLSCSYNYCQSTSSSPNLRPFDTSNFIANTLQQFLQYRLQLVTCHKRLS